MSALDTFLHSLTKTSSISEIQKQIYSWILQRNSSFSFCTQTLGEGAFGIVSKVFQFPSLTIHNKQVPIVFKQFNFTTKYYKSSPENSFFSSLRVGKDLLLFSSLELSCESILLSYLTMLYDNNEILFVPRLFGTSLCHSYPYSPYFFTDTLVIEQQGLLEDIQYSSNKKKPFLKYRYPMSFSSPPSTLSTRLLTFHEYLHFYTFSSKKSFPSFKLGSYTDIAMNFIVPMLFTLEFLYQKHKIQLFDLHLNNIHLHWIRENETVHDIPLKNIHGFIFEFPIPNSKQTSQFILPNLGWYPIPGDVGIHYMKLQDHLHMFGDLNFNKVFYEDDHFLFDSKDLLKLQHFHQDPVLFGFGNRLSPIVLVEFFNNSLKPSMKEGLLHPIYFSLSQRPWFQKCLTDSNTFVTFNDYSHIPTIIDIFQDSFFDELRNRSLDKGKLYLKHSIITGKHSIVSI
jgi:hypothetical protein